MSDKLQAQWDIVRHSEKLADAIARFTESDGSPLPEAAGLGTDGTCWTDGEIRDWLAAFFRNANKMLKRKALSPQSVPAEPKE